MIDRRGFVSIGGLGLGALLSNRAQALHALQQLDSSAPANAPWQDPAAYLLRPGLLYLNHASIGTIPRVVHEAHVRYLAECETNPHVYMWTDRWNGEVSATRAAAARLLHCHADEVAITHNTTEGFNVLAQGLPLGNGDEVLFSSLNHASASAAWHYYAARRGYSVRRFEIPLDDVSGLSTRDFVALHEREIRPNTRVLVFPHVDNIVGIQHPTRELTTMARRLGVRFVAVDVAQSLGMLPVDVAAEGADFYAASPHKWVQAPKGVGLLVVTRAVRDRLEPLWVKHERAALPETAEVFEDYSTRNLPAVLALGTALEFQMRLNAAARQQKLLAIVNWFRTRIDATPELVWRSPRSAVLASSLFAVGVKNVDINALERQLTTRHDIVVRAFARPVNALRVSPNLINTESDADRFVGALTARA